MNQVNWKYISIAVILAAVVGGGILTWQSLFAPKEEPETPEVKPPELEGEGIRNGVLFLTSVTEDIYNLNVYDPSDNRVKFISQISPSSFALSQYAGGKVYTVVLREEPAKLISFDLETLQENVYEFPLRKSAGLFQSKRNLRSIIVEDNAAYLLRCKAELLIVSRVSDCLLERFDFNNGKTEKLGELPIPAISGSIRFFGFDKEGSRLLVSRRATSDVVNAELPPPDYYAFLLKENELVSVSQEEVSKLKNETCHNTRSEVPNLSQSFLNRVIDCVNISKILTFQKDNMLIPFVTIDRGGPSTFDKTLIEPTLLTVHTEKDWEEIWLKHTEWQRRPFMPGPPPSLPKVNFDEEMLIALFLGTRKPPEENVHITNIFPQENKLIIEAVRTIDECSPVNVDSDPYHIVKIKRTALEPTLNLQEEIVCSTVGR